MAQRHGPKRHHTEDLQPPPGWTVAIGAEPMLPLDPSELYADWKRPTQIEEDPIFGVPRANPARVMSSIIRARRGDMEVSFR